jgi:hypothetical protein
VKLASAGRHCERTASPSFAPCVLCDDSTPLRYRGRNPRDFPSELERVTCEHCGASLTMREVDDEGYLWEAEIEIRRVAP